MPALCRLESRSLPFKPPLELSAGHGVNICVYLAGGKICASGMGLGDPTQRKGLIPELAEVGAVGQIEVDAAAAA
jgi:hypothetical protein